MPERLALLRLIVALVRQRSGVPLRLLRLARRAGCAPDELLAAMIEGQAQHAQREQKCATRSATA